jgi:hypothetical protein
LRFCAFLFPYMPKRPARQSFVLALPKHGNFAFGFVDALNPNLAGQ